MKFGKVILEKPEIVRMDKSNYGRYIYGRITINLPREYIGKKVKVIVLELE